jgi:ABC-type cobalamin/Fe3+-siderophores transport system ATPase subunit
VSDNAIVVEGLAKRFGEVVALDGIDFQVLAGSVFGLLGPNGAGKTTAIRILTTILRPDGGRAEVLGLDVVGQADEVRYRIGLAGPRAPTPAGCAAASTSPPRWSSVPRWSSSTSRPPAGHPQPQRAVGNDP